MPTHQERTAQTDAAIINALVAVGKIKPLNRITISDLTRASGISRGTFYLHYLDKEDLVTRVESHFADRFQKLLNTEIDGSMDYRELTEGEPYPVIVDLIALSAENKALLCFLFGSNGDPTFYKLITDKLQTAILGELRRVKGSATFRKGLPRNYALHLVTNTIMTIVTTWLMEQDDLSQDEIAAVIMRALYLSPYEILGIENK